MKTFANLKTDTSGHTPQIVQNGTQRTVHGAGYPDRKNTRVRCLWNSEWICYCHKLKARNEVKKNVNVPTTNTMVFIDRSKYKNRCNFYLRKIAATIKCSFASPDRKVKSYKTVVLKVSPSKFSFIFLYYCRIVSLWT